MNPELEKLLEITLTDGYLSHKERDVLRKKGESLGISADEVDIMIESRLYEINKANKKKESKYKCPACGESIKEFYRNCPSCDTELDDSRNFTEKKQKKAKKNKSDYKEPIAVSDYDIYKKELAGIVHQQAQDLQIKKTKGTFFWVYTLLTFGIYAVVKKIIVGGNVFDGNTHRHAMYIVQSDLYIGMCNFEKSQTDTNDFIDERDKIILKKRVKNIVSSILSAFGILLIALMLTGIVGAFKNFYVNKFNTQHLDDYDILSNEDLDRDEKEQKIRGLLITLDSLKKANNFIAYDSLIITQPNRDRVTWLIDRRVSDLIEERKFKEAQEFKAKMEHGGLLSAYQTGLSKFLIINDSIGTSPTGQINKNQTN